MQIIRTADYAAMSKAAALRIAAQIIHRPDSVLGLATGSTPAGTYRQLAAWYEEGALSFAKVTTINLDEYRGLDAAHPQSYHAFMRSHLFDHVNVPDGQVHLPDGAEPDAQKACRDYDAVIARAGGIDLQLLGIGHNGHIGFNEPGTRFDAATHMVELSQRTIRANRRFFASEKDVPRFAYTVGIRTIMQAKHILLLASGEDKAGIVGRALTGPVTPEVPASVLQLHPDLTVIVDEDAAGKLCK